MAEQESGQGIIPKKRRHRRRSLLLVIALILGLYLLLALTGSGVEPDSELISRIIQVLSSALLL